MKLYMAPLEGITTYIYRNAYDTYFQSMDGYYAPFIVAGEQRTMSGRERGDLLPERNQGINLVPQILTNSSTAFINTAGIIRDMGYDEVNLNLGCPSGTVVAKGKGAGFLAEPERLDHFLEDVFSWGEMDITIKTRIGKYDSGEFHELLEIFNKYPIKELIIHPRIQQDFYGNKPQLEVFEEALKNSRNPLCYNGDIFTRNDYANLMERFPKLGAVMLGRGAVSNPWLVQQIHNRKKEECMLPTNASETMDIKIFREFHNQILGEYQKALSGDRNVLFKMKELWVYFLPLFRDAEKEGKKIRKAQKVAEYQSIAEGLFASDKWKGEKSTEK